MDLLKSFALYYHDEYGENIVSGAIDSFIKTLTSNEQKKEKCNPLCDGKIGYFDYHGMWVGCSCNPKK